MHLSTPQAHLVYVESLAFSIFLAHEYFAFHVHQRRRRSRGNTVLTCARFSNNARFTHLLGKQNLPEHVIDLMRTGVVQVFTLQVDLCATQRLGQTLGIVQKRRTIGVFVQKLVQLRLEFWVIFVAIVSFLELDNGIHQRFRHVLPTMDAESSLRHNVSFHESSILPGAIYRNLAGASGGARAIKPPVPLFVL